MVFYFVSSKFLNFVYVVKVFNGVNFACVNAESVIIDFLENDHV
jgi:hypothetical protein